MENSIDRGGGQEDLKLKQGDDNFEDVVENDLIPEEHVVEEEDDLNEKQWRKWNICGRSKMINPIKRNMMIGRNGCENIHISEEQKYEFKSI